MKSTPCASSPPGAGEYEPGPLVSRFVIPNPAIGAAARRRRVTCVLLCRANRIVTRDAARRVNRASLQFSIRMIIGRNSAQYIAIANSCDVAGFLLQCILLFGSNVRCLKVQHNYQKSLACICAGIKRRERSAEFDIKLVLPMEKTRHEKG
jgi:hypothetical protein